MAIEKVNRRRENDRKEIRRACPSAMPYQTLEHVSEAAPRLTDPGHPPLTAPHIDGALEWLDGIAALGYRWRLCGMVRRESIGCARKSGASRIVNRRTSTASESAAICGSCRASWLDYSSRRDLERRCHWNGNLTVAVATNLGNRCVRKLYATSDAPTLAAIKARSVAKQALPVGWGNAVRLPPSCRRGPDARDFA